MVSMAFRLTVMASVAVALHSLVVGASVVTAGVRAMITMAGLSFLVALAHRASSPSRTYLDEEHKGKHVNMVAGDD
jgi:hypothetical protein